MKPCPKNRKLISWLALGALDARETQTLRAHLEICAGCRDYWAELHQVTQQLAAAKPQEALPASESFHRGVVRRLAVKRSIGDRAMASLQALAFNWRVAAPVAVGLVALLALVIPWPRAEAPLRPLATAKSVPLLTVAAPAADADLSPTLANYQRAASQSVDQLDELMVRQEKPAASPTPVYTASSRSLNF